MIKTEIKVPLSYNNDDIKNALCERIPVTREELKDIRILKRTMMLRDKSNIHYKMTVALALSPEREAGLLKMRKTVFPTEEYAFSAPISQLKMRPIVVGSGPCGLFAALTLAKVGAKPIVIERGLPVEERALSVKRFVEYSSLDTESNIQFGEGGAGAYSDGKLKVGSMDKYKSEVLSEFIVAGASEEISYSSTAHLGTDKLSDIIKNIREKIISLGGEFIYSAKLTDIIIDNYEVKGAIYEKNGEKNRIFTDNLILAIGHSARDTFRMLKTKNLPMQAKGFGVGVRIEHPREYINSLVYGADYPDGIETASYHLVTHLENGRSVYSFCMCPGGTVVAATSAENSIVTNGMSEYARDAENSNAAFLVSVTPEDFASDDSLAGMEYQEKIEKAAYAFSKSYSAPAISMADFLSNAKSLKLGTVAPSYPLGVNLIRPEEYLPSYITESLKEGIADFDKWMGGFYYGDAVLTGPETRTTSPVRILRTEKYEVAGISGLYPAGEGAGYSGGIISSAVDGVRCAEAMLLK